MNHVYRLKRSGRTQQLQPVPETARSASKGSASTGKTLGQSVGSTLASFALSGLASLAYAQQAPPAVNQLPQGGVVTRGSANINTNVTPAGNALMTVNQASNRAVIDWASFNVGSQAKVQFNQPGASAVTLNNILGNNASQIYGQISANGQVFLSNPNGIYFSPTAQVNVGGLVAATGKANADDFMAGKASFNRDGNTASVINQGQLKAALGGYIALLAPEVRNQGVVIAQAGTVALASGEAITLSFNNTGTGLAGITTTPQAIATLVENRSAVLAEGGQIILSAHALASLQGAVVKNSGQLSATSLSDKGGKIVLMADKIELTGTSKIDANGATGGGTVLVGGDWQGTGDTRQATKVTMAQGASIEANATSQGDGGKVVLWSDVHNANSVTAAHGTIQAEAGPRGGKGGQVETSGHHLNVDGLQVSTQAPQGVAGLWLLDPYDITISGASGTSIAGDYTSGATSTLLASSITAALASGNVTVATGGTTGDGLGSGNIKVLADLSWSTANVLTLQAHGGISSGTSVYGTGAISMTGAAGAGVVFNQAGDSLYAGALSGTNATVTKKGAGTLTLLGSNSHMSTDIQVGILRLGNYGSALGNTSATGTVTVHNGAALDLNGNNIGNAVAKPLSISGTGVNGGGALMNSSSFAAYYGSLGNGLLTLAADSAIVAEAGSITLGSTGTINSSYTLTLGGAAGGGLSSIYSGTGSLVKLGVGKWTLYGSNTYSGETRIYGGILRSQNNTSLGTSAVTVYSGGTLDFGSNVPTGATSLTLNGMGANGIGALVAIGGPNNATAAAYNNPVVLGSDSAMGGDSPLILTNAGGVTGAYTLTLGGTSLSTYSSISGPLGIAALVKKDAGTWKLSGDSTFTGGTTVTGGKLQANAAGGSHVFGASSNPITINAASPGTSATLDLSTYSQTAGAVTIGVNGGSITGFSVELTGTSYTINNTGANAASIQPVLGGAGVSLTKNGTGTLVLTGINTYTGSTTINAGTVQVGSGTGSAAAIASASAIAISAGATLAYNLPLGASGLTAPNTLSGAGTIANMYAMATNNLSLTGANLTGFTGTYIATVNEAGAAPPYIGGITLTSSPVLSNNAFVVNTTGYASAFTTSNVFSWSGTPSGAPRSLSLNGVSVNSGATAVGGTLTLNASNITVGAGYTWSLNNNGVVSNFTSTASPDASTTNLTGNATATVAPGVTAVKSGQISGAFGLTVNGGGTLKLSGANTYSGGSMVSAGTLQAGSATAFGSGAVTVASGAAVDLNGQTMTSTGRLTLNGTGLASGGALTNSSATVATYAGLLSLGSDASIVGGSGSIVLSNTGTFIGATYGLTLGGAVGGSVASAIGTTTGTLTKIDAGTWTLSGANTYSGATSISAGILKAGSATAFGTGGIRVSPNAVLDLNGQTMTSTGGLTLNGTGVTSSGALINSASAAASYAGLVTLGSNSSIIGGAGSITLCHPGTITGDGFSLTLGGAQGGSIASVIGTNTGSVSLSSGSSTTVWTLSGANTYSGGTTITTGTLKVGSSTALGTGAVTVQAVGVGTALDLNGQTMTSVGGLSLAGTGVNSDGALRNSSKTEATYAGLVRLTNASFIIGDTGSIALTSPYSIYAGNQLTLGGAVGGRIDSAMFTGLIKNDVGTWTLTGAYLFNGGYTISNGTLQTGNGGTGGALPYSGTITMNPVVGSSAALLVNLSDGASTPATIAVAAGRGAATVSNVAYGSTLKFTGAMTSSTVYVNFAASVDESTSTPSVASIVLPSGPNFLNKTLSVNTKGYQSSLTSVPVITWAGTSTNTPTLNINGNVVTSAVSSVGGTLTLNASNLSLGAGYLWTLTNNNSMTSGYTSATDSAGATLTGNAVATIAPGASVTQSGTITGAYSLSVVGNGTLTLSGAGNNYSGGTNVNAGSTLRAGSDSALGSGAITVASGASLDLGGRNLASAGTLTLSGAGINNSGALMNSGGAASYGGRVALGADTSIVGGSGTIALTSTSMTGITGAYALTLGGVQGGSIGTAINTGTGTVTKQDAGTWTLSGYNTYSGGTFINGGTLQIGIDDNLGAVPGTAATNITINGGTLAMAGQSNAVFINANRRISIGSSGGAIANNGAYALDVLGNISSTGAVTLTGGDITFGNIAVSNASPILVKSTGNIVQSASSTVSTAGGAITYWADSDGSGDGKITVSNGVSGSQTQINANGGSIVLGGGSGASAAAGMARGLNGVYVGNDASVLAGTGSVTIQGEANASGASGGVYIGSSSTVSGANVTMIGTGYANSSASSYGVRLLGTASASNLLTINGTGGGTASTSTSNGNNYGVFFYGGVAEATGAGNVVINGTGGGYVPGAGNHGLYMQAYPSATSIRSVTGSVLVTATAGPASSTGASLGYSMPTNTGSVTLGGSTQTGALTLRSDSWNFGPTTIEGSGVVTLEPLTGSTSFASTGLNLTYVTLSPTINALTLGKAGNTARVAVGPEGPGVTFPVTSYSVAGPISIYGDIYLGTPLATTGTGANGLVTLSGNVTEVENGKLTAPSLLLLGTGASNVAMSNQYSPKGNLIGTLSGSGLGTVGIDNGSFGTATGAGALTVGTVGGVSGLSATGTVTLNTYRDNLTLVNDVVSTNTGTSAVTLSAGRYMAVGDVTNGNVILNGGTITTGTGGRAVVYTGSVAGSTGVGALVGSGSGRFRYGSTALATFSMTNYTTALDSSGYYAIYRERPTVTWTSSTGQTIAYGATPVSPTADALAGFVNGDTIDTTGALRLASDNSLASVNASGLYNVGSYVYSRTEGAKGLGYLVNNPALTIGRAVVTVTANDATKIYDGLGYSGGNGARYSGFVGADTAGNSLRGTLTYSGTSQGAVNADTYVITPGGQTLANYAALNYTLSYAPGTLTVAKVPLTVRINNDARFLTETDAAAYAGASYAGFVARQTPSVLGGALTISRTGGDTLAGTYNGVLMGSGLTSGNYSFNYVPGSYTIVPADQLLVKVSNTAATYASEPVYTVASAKYFRSSTNSLVDLTGRVQITGNAFSLNDGAGGTTAFTLGAASPSLSLGGQLNVGAYQLGSSGIVTNANYSNTMTLTGALQVNPKAVTAAVTSSVNKTYDGTLGLNGLTLGVTGAVTGDALGANGAGAYGAKDVGTGLGYSVNNIALAGADARNYVLTDSVTHAASNTLTGSNGVISAVPLTVAASNASKTYDGLAYSGGNGVTFSGFVNNETAVDLGGALAYGGTSQTATNAGTYSIIPSGYSSTNYSIGYVNGALTIAPANVSAIVGALQGSVSKVYDGTQVATLNSGHYELSGWVGLDGATVTRTLGSYDTTSAGTYKTVTVNLTSADYALNPGTLLSNYILPTTISGPVGLITAKPVTVTSTARTSTYDAVSTYGSLASGVAFSTSDLVGADVVGSVTQSASGTGVTSSGVAQAGSFSVTPSRAVMGVGNPNNYSFSYVDSVYTVNPVVVTVRSMTGALQGAVNKVYDGTNAATLSSANYALTGWVGSDGATVTRTLGSYDTVNVGTGKTVTVMLSHSDFQASGSTQLSNYLLPTMVSGAVGSITKATLTPSITASSKVYDTTTDATGSVSLAGVFSADAASASAVAASYSFDTANVGTGKTVTVSGISLGVGIASNYQLSSTQAAGLANITPAPLTVTAINSAKFVTQGDQPGYGGYAVTGLLGGQTPANAGISAGVTVSRSNSATHAPGEYIGVLVPVGNATIGNYAVSYVPGTYTIVPARQLLVQATSSSTTYGTAGIPVLASVSYLDDSSNTITDLTLSSQAVVGGNTVYTYSDGASGTVSFSAAPAGTSLSAGGFVNVGSYGLAASNFSKTTSNLITNTVTMTGNFMVQPLATTVAATPGVTAYNSATQTQSITSGLLSGDAVSIAGAVRQRNAGSYTSALSLSGNDAANYRVTYANSNYTITPVVLNATFAAADKVYDGNTTASLSSTDNRLGSDVLTVSATGRFADKNVGTAKQVTVSAVSLSGADAANYTVSTTSSTTANITRLQQVSWVGGSSGSWFDPANWAGGAVPDLANVANVTIPLGVTVNFDNLPAGATQAGLVQLDSLGTAGSLNVSEGALNVGAGGVTLDALTQSGGALTTPGAVRVTRLSQSAGSLSAGSLSTIAPFSHTGSGNLMVAGQVVPNSNSNSSSDVSNLPLLPLVLTPAVHQGQEAYQVTVLKLPQGDEQGTVHIALRDGLADVEVPLPEDLQDWIKAAGSDLSLLGAEEGIELSANRSAIRLSASPERRFPLQLAMQAGEQRVSVRIVQRP